jgi:hypothetical protein
MKKYVFIAVAVAVGIGAGASYAAIPDGNGVISGCYWTASTSSPPVQKGHFRIIDSSTQHCNHSEAAISWNQAGQQGPQGARGLKGDPGDKGDKGDQGPAWTPTYGTAYVYVKRGTGNPAEWADYTTTIGSPAPRGDNTGGTFRFTCRDTQAPCAITIAANVSSGTATVYPRLLIQKQDYNNGGPSVYCEYADGINNGDIPANYGSVSTSVTPLTMGIGGTLDCPGTTQSYPGAGTASEIDVPAGYYDVQSTFYFKSSNN